MIILIWLYMALNRTCNIACYGGGGSTQGLGLRVEGLGLGKFQVGSFPHISLIQPLCSPCVPI